MDANLRLCLKETEDASGLVDETTQNQGLTRKDRAKYLQRAEPALLEIGAPFTDLETVKFLLR